MSLLVIAYNIPPISNAFSNVVGSLFAEWDYTDIAFITGNKNVNNKIIDGNFVINHRQYVCDIPPILRKRSFRIGLPIILEHILLPYIVFRMARVVLKEKPDNIFTFFPNHMYVISTLIVSVLFKLPLYIYFVDEWQKSRPSRLQRKVGKFFENGTIRYCKKAFFMTDILKDIYMNRYKDVDSKKFKILNLPTNLEIMERDTEKTIDPKSEIIICFTGAIYGAQNEPILNLIEAIKLLSSYRIKLKLITFQSDKTLEAMGINADFIEVFKANRTEALEYQRNSDILFLPMSFLGENDIVTTASMPSKVLEYFVSKTPILVHAPIYTFIGKYARKQGFGLLVHVNSPAILAKELEILIKSPSMQKNLIENAEKTYWSHHYESIQEAIWHEM